MNAEAEIHKIMSAFRKNPVHSIAEQLIVQRNDYQNGVYERLEGATWVQVQPPDIPPSNVISWLLQDGDRIIIRPSGTEPKIKFYFEATLMPQENDDIDALCDLLDERIDGYLQSLLSMAH